MDEAVVAERVEAGLNQLNQQIDIEEICQLMNIKRGKMSDNSTKMKHTLGLSLTLIQDLTTGTVGFEVKTGHGLRSNTASGELWPSDHPELPMGDEPGPVDPADDGEWDDAEERADD